MYPSFLEGTSFLLVENTVLASPFHNARYVFDEDFANRLLCFAENAKDNAVSGFADEMIEKAKVLIEYQKLAKYGDL